MEPTASCKSYSIFLHHCQWSAHGERWSVPHQYAADHLPRLFWLGCRATPDGRLAGQPFSEGISPVQGADRQGPTAVIKSASKMDHLLTGGTLLNLKFTPSLLADGSGA